MDLSRVKTTVGATRTTSTVPGTLIMYMAPEGVLDHIRPDIRFDIWSICATSVELMVCQDFWSLEEGNVEAEIMKRMRRKTKPDGLVSLQSEDRNMYITGVII